MKMIDRKHPCTFIGVIKQHQENDTEKCETRICMLGCFLLCILNSVDILTNELTNKPYTKKI